MRSIKQIDLIILILVMIVFMSGCSLGTKNNTIISTENLTATTESSEVTSTQSSSETSDYTEFDNNPYWQKLFEETQMIGKSFGELSKNETFYYWDGMKDQYIFGYMYGYYFPECIWKEGVVNTAVAVSIDKILQNNQMTFNTDELTKYFGNNFQEKKDEEGNSYYEFLIDGYEYIFPKLIDENIDYYIVIKNKGTSIGFDDFNFKKINYVTIDPNIRKEKQWQGIERFVSQLRQDQSKILIDSINWVNEKDLNEYTDFDKNITYGFDSDGKCDSIYFPAEYLIGSENESLTMDEMINRYPVSFVWGNRDDCGYQYEFDDITVRPQSDETGTVKKDDMVYLSIQTSYPINRGNGK